jgi:hypothetical protein
MCLDFGSVVDDCLRADDGVVFGVVLLVVDVLSPVGPAQGLEGI